MFSFWDRACPRTSGIPKAHKIHTTLLTTPPHNFIFGLNSQLLTSNSVILSTLEPYRHE